MSSPHALIEFFQKEALAQLGRLDQLLADPEGDAPDTAAMLLSARALRGSATMTRLEGLPDLALTLERIITGVRDQAVGWDRRLHLALRGALIELRVLVERAGAWTEVEQRQSRTQSVALAAVAAGYLAADTREPALSARVVPIARLFPDDGMPGVVQRSAAPPITLARRFRDDIATAADAVARETATVVPTQPGAPLVADGARRALLALADVADSYGAASIVTLATNMARAPMATAREQEAVRALARLLLDRSLTDPQLAQQVQHASRSWNAAPADHPVGERALIPIESLLYRGQSALARARTVRDELKTHWQRGTVADPAAHELFEELSDLLDLAVTT